MEREEERISTKQSQESNEKVDRRKEKSAHSRESCLDTRRMDKGLFVLVLRRYACGSSVSSTWSVRELKRKW